MCDDDAGALVIDNGSGMCKAGFAGDDAPRYLSTLMIYVHSTRIFKRLYYFSTELCSHRLLDDHVIKVGNRRI